MSSAQIGMNFDTPRACLRAGVLCEEIDFAYFDMEELTQLTFGMGAKDSKKFLFKYLRDRTMQVCVFFCLCKLRIVPEY